MMVDSGDGPAGEHVIVGFDCEYQTEGDHNRLLSYQAHGIAPDGRTWEFGWLTTKGERVTLSRASPTGYGAASSLWHFSLCRNNTGVRCGIRPKALR